MLEFLFPTTFFLWTILLARLIRSYFRWRMSPLNVLRGDQNTSYVLGSFFEITREPFMAPHKRWWANALAKRSEVDMLYYTTFFGKSTVVLLNADLVKQVLTSQSSQSPVRFPKNFVFLQNILGDGLVTLEGTAWSRHRRIIQPSFHTGFLKEALNASVPRRVQTLLTYWNDVNGREIDVASHLSALTLDIIGDVAFSHDFAALEVVRQWTLDQNGNKLATVSDRLITSLLDYLKPNQMRVLIAILGYPWMDRWFNPNTRRSSACLNEAVDNIILQARDKTTSTSLSKTTHKSLLDLLFDAEDAEPSADQSKKLSHTELRDETKTFLVAGHETTSTWAYWAFFALVKYPNIQQRVFTEIMEHAPSNTIIDLEVVHKMTYLAAFCKEVLRMYPPVGMIIRQTSREENFCGHTIPPHTRLVIAPHLLHRHPSYWSDPEDFLPDRWLDDDCTERHRFCYLPFSAGGRNCVGQRFATMEVKLMLAPIIRAFELKLAPSLQDVEFTFTNVITMKAKPDFKVCLVSRSAVAC